MLKAGLILIGFNDHRKHPFLLRLISLFVFFLCSYNFSSAQTAGQVMFVGFNADGNSGFSFVTFVSLPNNTSIRFNDHEWGGAAFDNDTDGGIADGSLTWTNNTGTTIGPG